MRPPVNLIGRRVLALWVVIAALAFPGFVSPSNAQFTLSDNNSVASVDPNSQAGMNYWAIQGQNQLHQQWFWYSTPSIGPAPASINTISAPLAVPFNGTRGLSVTYANAAFNVNIDYLLSGGAVVPVGDTGVSDISESIRIQNTTAAPLPFTFYQYSDFDLGGPGNDTVQLGMNSRGLFNEAIQTDPLAGLTETVVTPGANHGEAALTPQTLNELNNGVSPVTLNNNAGPVGPGDATWGLEWDFVINPGATALISKDKYLTVVIENIPEPSALALLGLGAASGLAWKRRRAGN
jgi:hypothetical protein